MKQNSEMRLDDNQYGFFTKKQLEFIKAKTYDIVYPNLMALDLLPVSTDAPAWADEISYYTFDMVGLAKIISDYADDLPTSDVRGTKTTSEVRSIGNSYKYNVMEIIKSQALTGAKPLDYRRAVAAKKAHDIKINQLAWSGDAVHGLSGFATNPNVTRVDVAANGNSNGGTNSTLWKYKTPQQIYDDMTALITNVNTLTMGIEMPDTLIMPLEQFNYIKRTPFSPTFMAQSILAYFKENNPGITVVGVNELKGAGSGGEDIMIAYEKNEDKLTLELPMPFNQLPPEKRNLEYVIDCHSRFGGVIIYYPLSVAIGEGI